MAVPKRAGAGSQADGRETQEVFQKEPPGSDTSFAPNKSLNTKLYLMTLQTTVTVRGEEIYNSTKPWRAQH